MATKVNGFEAGSDGTTIPSGASNADPDSFTVALTGTVTQVYSSTTPAHGSLCGLATAVTAGDTVTNTFTGFTGGTLTCSIYLRVAAYPSGANVSIIKVRNSSSPVATVNLKTDGKLEVFDRYTLKHTTASAIGTGAWIRIEITATKGTTTSDGRVQFAYYSADSTTPVETAYDSGATVNAGTTDMAYIQLGWLSGVGTGALRLDSWQGVESALPVGPWTSDPLANEQTDDAGATDAGWSLDTGLTVTVDDDAGATDDIVPDEGVDPGDPPAGGGPSAALDSATLAGGVVWLFGLQESQGARTAGDTSGAPGRPTLTFAQTNVGGTAEFGAAGIMPEGTALLFTPERDEDTGLIGGLTLGSGDVSAYLGTEFAVWLQFAWTGSAGVRLLTLGSAGGARLVLSATASTVVASLTTAAGSGRVLTVTAATGDNRPHMALLTASGNTLVLYVDTTEQNATTLPADMGRVSGLTLGGTTTTNPHQVAWVGYANAALTPARAADLLLLGSGGSERSDLRVARICRWLGVDPDLVAETGLSDVAYQATGDQQALDLIAAVNEVEDGVFFPAGDGTLRQHSRDHRYDAPVRIALPATDVNPDLAVQVDLARVVNDLSVSRPSGATYRARNQTSIDAYGPRVDARTLYAASDDDLRLAAEWRLARYGIPAPRIPSVSVNLLAADEATARAVLGLEVGDRIQVTGMPDTTPGGTTVDLFVEGFDEALSATDWRVTLATSPWFDVRTGVLDTAELGDVLLAY